MKYFSYELWKKFNSTDEAVRDKANNDWLLNIDQYNIEFNKVETRLSKKFLRLFMKNDYFHDFYIYKLEIQQGNKLKFPSVSLIIKQDDEAWEIVYTKVRKINVDYSSDINELGFENGFGTWGYSEFLEVDCKLISHEILLSSGAIIFLWFETVKCNKLL